MTHTQSIKRKNIHTWINVGLTLFLILVATVGMRGLSVSSIGDDLNTSSTSTTQDKIMVCAIGQCLFI